VTAIGGAAAKLAEALIRIDRLDDRIGAFVDVRRDDARAAAANADAATAAGRLTGPLHGVPIGVKELFDVAGADGSYGSAVLAGRRADRDAAVVTALRRAGAIVVGTTRSHEFGWGITTQHTTRGSTRNPWDLDRIPGGSSGGSAAAVSAGIVPLAIGSDTGGSIRLPAAFCGVLGLKTTFGRISRVGGVALAPSFDSAGFLARSVGLLGAAFAASSGRDLADPATAGAPPVGAVDFGPSAVAAVRRLRFAAPAGLSPERLPEDRTGAVASMCAALEDLGLQQTEVRLPDARELYDVFVPLQMAEAHEYHSTVLGTYPAAADRYGSDVRSRLDAAASVTIAQYLRARRQQDGLRAEFARAFAVADVLVSPVGATGPSRVATPDKVTMSGADAPLRTAMMPYTVPQNLAGLPSITCPLGSDAEGMPIGIQLTGAPWSEPMLLGLASVLEAAGLVVVGTPPTSSH
jgi:aspartyl-tRNA(Asn)/glutamyl-tRNA(Gln) amidotransferase subunit A